MSQLKLEILESRDNKLIGRKELIVRIDHWPQGTPPRKELRERIAQMLKVNPEAVYVRKVKTEYGKCESLARIHVYESAQRALQIEPAHVVKKNKGAQDGGEGGG